MKEPKGHTYDDYDECVRCEKPWPCKTYRRFMKSKSYRLTELEAQVKNQAEQISSQARQLDQLRDRAHRLEVLVKGVWPAVNDLLKGAVGGSLTVGEDVDYQDFTSWGGRTHRVAGLRDFYCTYESPDGTSYRNGEFTERTYRKP